MKQVLIIDESPLFREYLRTKLEENGIDVSFANNPREGIAKIRNIIPDLVIMDLYIDQRGFFDLLNQKKNYVHTANIPVVIMAQHLEQGQLIKLAPYNIKKIFTKPVKIDALFNTLSEILEINFNIDESPSLIEANVNDNIIFIEIAQGLNRDKLELLHFKLRELLGIYKSRDLKVIMMFSDIQLGPVDSMKLIRLFSILLDSIKVKPDNIRVLAVDDFIRTFIGKKREYSHITVVSNLQDAMDGLLSQTDKELIAEKILQGKGKETAETREEVPLKFDADARDASIELVKNLGRNLRIAVIDDDFFFHEVIKGIFQKVGAAVTTFFDGEEFLMAVDTWDFDLAFLDLNMPNVNGFEVLKALQSRKIQYPIIVLSSITQREAIIKVIQMGVRSYLTKPINPDDVFRKSIEILKANF